MLSTHHSYSPEFGNGTFIAHGYMPSQHMSHSGLDTLAEGSQYALQQLQQQQQQQQAQQQGVQSLNSSKPPMRHRESFDGVSVSGMADARRESVSISKAGRAGSGSSQTVRRRISRACDQCNQLRTKCDGKHPCAHCVEFGLTCEYARERKKRGKASRKDIAAQQAAAAAHGDDKDGSPTSPVDDNSDDGTVQLEEQQRGIKRRRSSSEFKQPRFPPPPRTNSMTSVHQIPNGHVPPMTSIEQPQQLNHHQHDPHSGEMQHARMPPMQQQPPGDMSTPRLPSVGMTDRSGMPVGMDQYNSSIDDYHRSILHPAAPVAGNNILHNGVTGMPNQMIQGGTITGYGQSPYAVPSPGSQPGVPGQPFQMGESPISAGGFLGQSPVAGSPGWLSLPSPSAALYPGLQQVPSNQVLRYPVLRPLLPHISAIIPIGLACDLLELYFSSTSSAFMQPQSPYILGYIFRKRSFLRPNNPRICSPALLASMLWVAAQTSESPFLTSPPSARGKICQKLLELTVGLLKPLIHTPADGTPGASGNTVMNGIALGGFGVALPGQALEMEGGSPGASGQLDDVATYIHLATVVSASEYKAASLRWWNSAWSLARELKLGRELPTNLGQDENNDLGDGQMDANGESMGAPPQPGGPPNGNQPGMASEEEREERRRIWWLLYIVDRHLALCYNRPLYLLDIECDGLLQPENDMVWQSGDYYPDPNRPEASYYRRAGPTFECTGHGIFGYFLPLMTMLGEIVDLNHARNHPRFGMRVRNNGNEWDAHAHEITAQLDAYGQSLKEFEAQNIPGPGHEQKQATDGAPNGEGMHHEEPSPSNNSVGTSTSHRMTEATLQTRIVVAYATHLMHTLHILLNGKWDPISLLDDNDLWISSQSFISATGHAVSAAEAINEILDYDPDLSFMPFFFGIYLLQGSFLLLLIADKLQGEASPSVVKACESIVRAHEACVVTLNTEYQRNFRKVMRSALSQVRGRMVEDFGEQQLRRREVLALYRWTGDGTGLAL
ncbi:uncharacterized protein LTR77_009113 [Saxophila tyrrhenica]|uniref:Zn(2)-C6 fungal-type domain-containing protein n=1 Tax=Saxophila tyrrhenica TaxID=1690608 RepID=A0AAV9P3D0_9PEZI|nr:hypothetical protein LTR77_009113 [Saxophila tyrrhenica]